MSFEDRKEFFENKQATKLERFQKLAEKKAQEAKDTRDQAQKMFEAIPMGQPILVGHHSEKSDRSFRNRMHNKFNKSIELADTAKHYTEKAENIIDPYAIKSDDPEAIIKLKEKIIGLEKNHAFWKAKKVNPNAKSCFDEDSSNWRNLQMTSLRAEIRRCQKRIDELQAVEKITDFDETINNIRFYSDKVENRIKIEFPGKPSPEIITQLKRSGFHWSPFNKVWQRMLNNSGLYALDRIKDLTK